MARETEIYTITNTDRWLWKKRNNCKKHLPHKIGHKGKNKIKKKILNIPNSEITALFYCEISPEKSIFTGTFIT